MGETYCLYGVPGYGSVLAEAALVRSGVAYVFENVDGFDLPGEARNRLLAVNPLAQVPALVCPDGAILTESAAIMLHLAEVHPEAGLAPPVASPLRRVFLRRLIWLVSSVYPTFTYYDYPQRWAPSAPDELQAQVMEWRKALWCEWDTDLGEGPWALGDVFSALDIYAATMTRWKPGRDWFAEHCPRLFALAERVDRETGLKGLWERNFSIA